MKHEQNLRTAVAKLVGAIQDTLDTHSDATGCCTVTRQYLADVKRLLAVGETPAPHAPSCPAALFANANDPNACICGRSAVKTSASRVSKTPSKQSECPGSPNGKHHFPGYGNCMYCGAY